jgi:alpha-tubulin suppressor-like RCC1 family protein
LGNDQPRGDRPEHVGRFAPADLPSPTVQIAAAGDQTCAIGVDGQLRCWGDLGGGQATDVGDEPDEMGSALRPFILGPGRRAERVFMGQTMRAVRLDDGSLRYWGTLVKTRQPGGREVRSTFTQFEDPLPVIQMAEGLTAVSFASGRDHACVLLDDGAVRCWGINFYGQLGAGGHSAVGDDPGEMGEGLPYLDLGWPSE